MDTLRCTQCQTPYQPGLKFCWKCGNHLDASPTSALPPTPLPVSGSVCPHCRRKNFPGARHCAFCGAVLAAEIACPRCRQSNRARAMFCTGCGQDLRGVPRPRPRAVGTRPAKRPFSLWIGGVLGILFGTVCFLVSGGTLALATGFLRMPEMFAPALPTVPAMPSPVPLSPTPTLTLTLSPTATASPTPTETPSPTPTMTLSPTLEPTMPPIVRPTGAPIVGKFAPDFTLKDARTGEMLTLSSLTGHPVMINFWTTWCAYCEDEMPLMEAAYQERAVDGLVILAIDVEEAPWKVLNFADNLGLSFSFLLDAQGNVAKLYRIYAYPTSYFITPEGVIHKIYLGSLTEGELRTYLNGITK